MIPSKDSSRKSYKHAYDQDITKIKALYNKNVIEIQPVERIIPKYEGFNGPLSLDISYESS